MQPHSFQENYGRPDFKLPHRWNNDKPLTLPLAPKNVDVTSPYLTGVLDIRWDNPTIYVEHNGLNVLGVNVYKSYDTPEGPYTVLNTSPVGALYYRDQSREITVTEDPMVGGRIIMGTNATGDWIVKTYNKPIIIPGTNGEIAQQTKHVRIEIKPTSTDSFQTVPAWRVVGETGEIFLINRPVYNNATNKCDPPVLPNPLLGGEIRVTYAYIDNWIQTDINRKIYYKVTTVAQDPVSHVTAETPLNEVEAYSPYDMEKIDWIWAEAIRRNMWMLFQAGERVKVFIRKWAGVLCTEQGCWDEQYKTAKQDCRVCFPAGQEVSLEDGSKRPIEQVTVLDRVLTIDGMPSNVLKTMSRSYEGLLITLKAMGKEEIKCTPEHPILVIDQKDCYCVRYRKTYNKNRCVPGKKRKCFEGKTPCNYVMTPKWVAAKDVKPGDYMLTPVIKETGLVTDKDKMFLLGLYAADGCVSWNGSKTKFNRVRFSLGAHEKELIKYTKNAFNSVYSIELREDHPKSSKRQGVTELYAHSDQAAMDMAINCGLYCHTKKLSQTVMYAGKESLKSFLMGYLCGDGCKSSRNGYEYSTVSKNLAYQIQLIFAKIGICCSISVHRQTGSWGIGNLYYFGIIPSSDAEKLKHSLSKISNKPVLKKQHKVLHFGDYVGHPVVFSKTENFSGTVYNMEIDRNNTYVVGNSVVHNCWGTGYVGGYEGPYPIIVAPPEAEKTVQLLDLGMHISYDWNSWTSPYPLLNDRDFIVRQNNDRLSIAHVNPQGSRGAIYQQHFMLSPLDQRDIRYYVPINGGQTSVPPSWNAYRTDKPSDASPVIPVKPEIPEYQRTGRTVSFENIVY